MTEQELRILEMQAPSTRKCLERSRDLDLEWLSRPIPKNAQVLKEDGTVDLGIRAISTSEEALEKRIRINRGAWIEGRWATEQKTPGVLPNEETKERAVESFLRSRTMQAIKNTFESIMKQVKRVSVWEKYD